MTRTQELMSTGLVFVCATCSRYEDSGCNEECGGPLKGLAYPRYDGPVTLANWCYVCGDEADAALVPNGAGPVGCCRKHLEMVENKARLHFEVRNG